MSTETIYNTLGARIKYFISTKVNDVNKAEDILHDVFIKIHDNIEKLKDPARLESWVFRITRNTISDYYRSSKPDSDFEVELVADCNKEEINERHQKASKFLGELINELPEKYREAILFTEFEGFTQKQLAEKLNISLTGAKSRVQRAKKMLRNLLLRCCHFEYDKYGTVIDYRKVCCCCNPAAVK